MPVLTPVWYVSSVELRTASSGIMSASWGTLDVGLTIGDPMLPAPPRCTVVSWMSVYARICFRFLLHLQSMRHHPGRRRHLRERSRRPRIWSSLDAPLMRGVEGLTQWYHVRCFPGLVILAEEHSAV